MLAFDTNGISPWPLSFALSGMVDVGFNLILKSMPKLELLLCIMLKLYLELFL